MAVLSRAQEREERRKLGRGLTTSVVALLLCWLPVVGFLLAAVGFIGIMRCITQKYRVRFIISLVVSFLVLVLCAGVLAGEVYAYSRDPNILENTGAWLLESITGQSVDGNYLGEDYSDMDYPGLGMNDELFSEGYYDAEGNFIPYETGGDDVSDALGGDGLD